MQSIGNRKRKLNKTTSVTHTDCIENVDRTDVKYTDVDGFITNKPNIDLTLSFADCTPILLYDPVKKVIANIHSGWRGTVQKIGKKSCRADG